MGALAQQAAMGMTFDDVKGVIINATMRFHKRFGGDLEESIAKAYLIFAQEYHKFDPSVGQAFHTWVGYSVYYQLIDDLRRGFAACRAPVGAKVVGGLVPDMVCGDAACQDPLDVLEGDAQEVAMLALCPPAHLAQRFAARGGEPRNVRAVLRLYLKEQGWPATRVAAAFEGVRAAW